MAEEEKNEQTEETAEPSESSDAPTGEAEDVAADQEAREEAAAEETPAEEAPAEEEAPGEEGAPSPDTPAGEAEEPSEPPDTPAAEGEEVADDEGIDWKARRRLERSRRPGEAGPQRSPEERASERAERRKASARGRGSYRRKQRAKGEGGEGTPPSERRSAGRKVRQGRVVSSKPNKTITIRIDQLRRHSAYEKIVRRSNTLHAHDEQNEANEGDLVRVVETRPLSRSKRWRLVEILEKAK
jgi:small subunit ribosomal protein S17